MLTPIKRTRQVQKPIFSSSSYLESSIGFCDLCFSIIDISIECYYACQSCDDFLACLACIQNPHYRLISHPLEHLFTPDKPRPNSHWINRNLSITCNLCQEKNFLGKRYQCRQCEIYNVCSNCLNQAKTTHYPSEKHPFDFIPNSTKIRCNHLLLTERTMQFLRYKNADTFERDPITGWTSNEATLIAEQIKHLYDTAWGEANRLLKDEVINLLP